MLKRSIAAALLLLGVSGLPASAYVDLTTNLVSYWKLDEASGSRVDAQGGQTLTDNNTVTSGTGLVYGTAAQFTAGNVEYLNHADNATLSVGNNDMTIAAWVNLDALVQNYDIVGKGDAGGYEWTLLFSVANLRWRFRTASATAEASAAFVEDGGGFGAGNGPSAGAWSLVIAWHDATNDVIGIASSDNISSWNGYTTAYSAGLWDSTGDFNIGRSSAYFPSYFGGRIGPVMMWKRVLTSTERAQLYNAGAGLTYAAITGGATPAKSKQLLLGVGGGAPWPFRRPS
jgi:hypothetical protein